MRANECLFVCLFMFVCTFICVCVCVFVSGFGRKTDDKRLSVWFRFFNFSTLFTVCFVRSPDIGDDGGGEDDDDSDNSNSDNRNDLYSTSCLTCSETIFTQ